VSFRRRTTRLVGLAFATAAGACDNPLGLFRGCDTYAAAGIVVALRDSASGRPWTDSVRVVATDGAFADTARHIGPEGNAALAYERPGRYTVTVEAPGTRGWRREGVRVRKDGCHVQSTHLTALLQRR
jgi:hypothetical protein